MFRVAIKKLELDGVDELIAARSSSVSEGKEVEKGKKASGDGMTKSKRAFEPEPGDDDTAQPTRKIAKTKSKEV